jgi:hypothetical protein
VSESTGSPAGKHYRAAQSGGWRASLSEAEQEIAGRILEPALIALGYDD